MSQTLRAAWPVIVLFLMVSASPGWARTILVPDEYPTIPQAMHEARWGDTVLVGPGNYEGPIDVKNGVVLKSTDGPEVTIIKGYRWWVVRLADADTMTALIGFTINGSRAADRVVYCAGGGAPRVIGNIIEKGWYGIGCEGSSPSVRNNVVRLSRQGIACNRASPFVYRNHITDNGIGIELTDSSPRIQNNRIDLNKVGIAVRDYSVPVIGGSPETANDIFDNFSFNVENQSLVKDEGIRTRIPALLAVECNFWGSDCPEKRRFYGAVDYKPWVDAEHEKKLTSCPKE